MVNEFKSNLNLAKRKYGKDVAVKALLAAIDRQMVQYDLVGKTYDQFAGYTNGLKGKDGYSPLMMRVQLNYVQDSVDKMAALVVIDELYQVLLIVMRGLGTEPKET